jgi:outer membrane immunogenic protein
LQHIVDLLESAQRILGYGVGLMKFKPLLLSPLGLIPGAMQADAADMPARVVKAPVVAPYVPSWAGFYVGLNVGVVSDESRQRTFLPNTPVADYCWAFDCNFRNKQTATGVLGGGQIGYNFQSASWVIGVEADIAAAGASKTVNGLTNGHNWRTKNGLDALGTARLRVGYAFDRALIYATGGLAYADLKDSFLADSVNAGYAWSKRTGWRAGWTVGGGIEYMFAPNWSVKGEGLYYDLGGDDHLAPINALPANVTPIAFYGLRSNTTGAVGRIGLNYLFR